MAFREVVLTDEEMKSGGRKFKKFDAIGDRHIGILLAVERTTKTFRPEEGAKTFNTYVFWNKVDGEFEISPAPTDLDKRLTKAMRPGSEGGQGLAPAKNHLVRMAFVSTTDTGQSSPMKVFKLEVDTEFVPPAGSMPPKSGQRPTPSLDEDVPF